MLELKKITKIYKVGELEQKALSNVSINFRKNEFASILGPSGSGKTTLLNIIGGLDNYSSGDLVINEISTKKYKDSDWDSYRNHRIGFVFQSYNLISHQSVLQNVVLALTLSGISKKESIKRAKKALKEVGLSDHIYKRPNQLSGGQMQRVAIARALVNDPEIILADEPTGALDSVTSVQIMNLLKKIAKDKLVIMVTHNPSLAEEYSNRIITLKDGKITSDTNPYDGKIDTKEDEDVKTKKSKKTSMSLKTALGLSFNNIKTKKGRTFLTSFAASIGIIGIALILSLSNGFQIKIDEYEEDTLSQMPITISSQAMSMDEETIQELEEANDKHKEFSNKKVIYPRENSLESMMHFNNISSNYVDYIDSMDKSYVSAVSYEYGTTLNVVTKNFDNSYSIVPTSTNYSMSTTSMTGVMGWSLFADKVNGDSMLLDNYELLAGSIDSDKPGVVIAVNSRNELDSATLKQLGFNTDSDISFEDILNKEFKVIPNDVYYEEINSRYVPSSDYEGMYNNSEAITIKINAIIRGKEDKGALTQSGIYYNSALVDEVINANKDSAIVNKQKSVDYNVLTGSSFDETTSTVTKDNILGVLGAEVSPSIIYIYPKDFETKDYITDYLDKYNEDKSSDDRILYTDYAALISTLSGSIMDAITYVLIAFSSISLIVSCIMIAIITYISVLERTKEIGILRSLGARGKDITRVFNAETFIIGVCSGVLGLVIAYFLTFPINVIIENLTDLPSVAKLNPLHATILLIISVTLTVLGGFVPSKMASKKDPVDALRTE